jgi:hypothetical protein
MMKDNPSYTVFDDSKAKRAPPIGLPIEQNNLSVIFQ